LLGFAKLLLIITIFAASPTRAANTTLSPITIGPELTSLDVSDNLIALVTDQRSRFEPQTLIREILAAQPHRPDSWQSNPKSSGYSYKGAWLYGQLENITQDRQTFILVPHDTSPSEFFFYLFDEAGNLLRVLETGNLSPLSQRDLTVNRLGLRHELDAGKKVHVLMWVKTKGLLDTHFFVKSLESQKDDERFDIAGYFLYFGVAIALLFHNFTLYLSMRDRVYIYYLLFVLASSSTVLFLSNFYITFWWRLPAAFANVPYSFPALANIAAVAFFTSYLRLTWNNSRLAKLSWILAIGSIGVTGLSIYDPIEGARINSFFNLAIATLGTSSCIVRMVQGDRYASYLLVAILFPVMAVFGYYFGNLVLKTEVPDDVIGLSFAFEMLLMSVGLSERVSSLKQRQIKLESQQALLIQQSRLRALNDLAASVAHEVNNPLMVISSVSDRLQSIYQKQTAFEHAQLESLAISLTKHSERIAFIVRALRWYATEEQECSSVLLAEVLRQSYLLSETASFIRGVSLNIHPYPQDIKVIARQGTLLRVLLALLNNAIEAAQHSQDKRVDVEAILDGSTVDIRISDSGAGLPEKVLTHLFEPFVSTKSAADGSGIGLSHSRMELEAMGASISYDHKADKTSFVIHLPVDDQISSQLKAS